jgi:excisionase family DNA binding protein
LIDNLMTVEALAEYLGVPVATVYAWNSRDTGPKRSRIGKHVRYRRADVDAWIDQRATPAGPRPA